MLTKAQLLETINDLPESFSMDDVLDRILLLQKIDRGLQQSIAGNTMSTDEAKEKLDKWLK